MKKPYEVTVAEVNEIAGQQVRTDVWVFRGKTLHDARRYAEERWDGRPPQGARIRDVKTGTVYDIPSR
jgi:hypothetical protein